MKNSLLLLSVLFILFACSNDEEINVEPIIPSAAFSSSTNTIVEGEVVEFINQSQDATSYQWTFEGGTPSVSTDRSPVITYNKSGNYSVSLVATSADQSNQIEMENFIQVSPSSATYTVTFQGKWSESSHPNNYPTNDHFSHAVGLTHHVNSLLYNEGELATVGIKDMAERGANASLKSEVEAFIASGEAKDYIQGKQLRTGTSVEMFDIELTTKFPMASLVSMIAPSPDWFVGVQNVLLFENGQFKDEVIIDAILYDSGTDSGMDYRSPNEVTSPYAPVTQIKSAPLGNGSGAPVVATFTFTKKSN